MYTSLPFLFKTHKAELNIAPFQKKIVNLISQCQTPTLGSHVIKCSNDQCDYEETMFNSCKSIYCPKCQSYAQLKWTSNRMDEVLPVDYMQIVFKIPTLLRPLIQFNPKVGLNALAAASKKAITSTFTKMDDQMGIISAIHSTTQLLNFSPHIHCLIPKGYLNDDKTEWIQIKKDCKKFQEKLSVQFKIHILKELVIKNETRKLKLPDNTNFESVESIFQYAKRSRFRAHVEDNIDDVNHSLKYLGSKTKKVIMSENRITSYENNKVTVSWMNRKTNKLEEKELDVILFLKRFLLHILPPRFNRIRYYGFLSNSCKKKSIELCRELIEKANIVTKKIISKVKKEVFQLLKKITLPTICPVCHIGVMKLDGL